MTSKYYKRIRPVESVFDLGLSDIIKHYELLYFFAWREFKIKYRQTAMGALWVVFQPLLATVVFTIIFGMLLKLKTDDLPYPLFAFPVLILWFYFSVAFATSSTSLVTNANILTKVYFPRMLIPMASCVVGLIDYTICTIFLIPLLIFYATIPPIWILLYIVPIALTVLLVMGLGFWLSAVCVKYRDVQYVVPFFVQVLFFVSPITYTITNMPAWIQPYLYINPLTGIMLTQRSIVTGASAINWDALIVSTVMTMLIFFGGLLYFKHYEREFADVI